MRGSVGASPSREGSPSQSGSLGMPDTHGFAGSACGFETSAFRQLAECWVTQSAQILRNLAWLDGRHVRLRLPPRKHGRSAGVWLPCAGRPSEQLVQDSVCSVHATGLVSRTVAPIVTIDWGLGDFRSGRTVFDGLAASSDPDMVTCPALAMDSMDSNAQKAGIHGIHGAHDRAWCAWLLGDESYGKRGA